MNKRTNTKRGATSALTHTNSRNRMTKYLKLRFIICVCVCVCVCDFLAGCCDSAIRVLPVDALEQSLNNPEEEMKKKTTLTIREGKFF